MPCAAVREITARTVWPEPGSGARVEVVSRCPTRNISGLAARKAELTALQRSVASGHNREADISVALVPDPMDNLELACERVLAVHSLEWASFLAHEISEALARIDDGTYGLCLRCGRAIAERRLSALPWAALCVGCQEAATHEDGERPG